MQTTTKRFYLARAAMTLFLAMLSLVVSAQSFVVVDKNGNRITFDVSKLDSVTFQQDPPAFTVYENVEETTSGSGQGDDPGSGDDPGQGQGDDPGQGQGDPVEPAPQEVTTFTFDEVASLSGDPDYLFSHPDTVYVNSEGQDFSFQLRTNMEYDYKISDEWLAYISAIEDTDSLKFSAGMNPMTTRRFGYIAFASNGTTEQMVDTLWVVQYGKLDSRYIAIDWSTTTLDNFDEASGSATLTFSGDVPVMGDYDVVLLPKDDSYVIRLIDDVQQAEGSNTVTLSTRQGLMGNLFKGTKFSLATEASAQARGKTDGGIPVYLPTKVEMITDDGCVELYDVSKAQARGAKAPTEMEKDFVSWEYNQDGLELWSSGVQSLSWDKLNFNIGLKGLFSFDFGDIPFEKVRMGDLQNLKITLDGGFDMEMILKYAVASEVKYEKEWTLKENAIPNLKYTFMVGTVPVYITVGADLMANISLGASGEASITTGVTASTHVNYGVEWDAEKGLSKIAECEKELELVGPDLEINAHAEARATAYPKIEIGIYKVLCPTISPQPYIKAEADGRYFDNKVAWNAGISTGIDLGLGLCLDLFFWKKDLGEIDPVNVFDFPLVSLPDEIELQNEKEEQMLINNQKEVKYHVTNKNYLTGTSYNAPGVLVKFEAEGGEVSSEYDYTDKDGNVSVRYTPKAGEKGGVVRAEVMLGAEPEKPEDAMKADDYAIEAIDYRLTGGSYTIPEGETSVDVTFQLDKYTSKTATWAGEAGRTVSFTSTNGTVSPSSGVTDSDGKVTVTFTAGDNFTEGSVTASVSGSDPSSWSKTADATIKADSGGDIGDDDLDKASKLKDNVYVIENQKTGETQERTYVPKWSEWRKDQDNINFSLEDADEDGGTQGMVYGFIPLTMTDVVLALTGETFENSPGAKFGFGVYEGTQLSADFAKFSGDDAFGNIEPESKIMLRKINSQNTASRARRAPGEEEYTGEYELLFYLVFKNSVWNPETQQEEEGDDYVVYGKGTMKMHLPTITSFQANTEKDWVKVGESTKVVLQSYYEEGATWDWNDVEIVGQSADYTDARNGVDDGFFSWDAATQTLTLLKTNDNKRVNVCLGLKSNPEVKNTLQVATGEGWKYTMIKTNPEEITDDANSYLSFGFEWAPKDSDDEKFDFTALEIDPETNPDGYFSIQLTYGPQGWPLFVKSGTPPGEYNIRFWIKSNHDINCTIKVTITEEQ